MGTATCPAWPEWRPRSARSRSRPRRSRSSPCPTPATTPVGDRARAALASMAEATAEMPKAVGVGMEEDALDLAFGHGQQHGGKRTVVPVEDQRRLPVEVPLLGVEL